MNEIEDAVPTRIQACNKGGPRYRTLRRYSCAETPEIAFAAKLVQIRERTPMPFEEARIHPVDSEHDDFFGGCFCPVARTSATEQNAY